VNTRLKDCRFIRHTATSRLSSLKPMIQIARRFPAEVDDESEEQRKASATGEEGLLQVSVTDIARSCRSVGEPQPIEGSCQPKHVLTNAAIFL
jgi:hypothetical protein